METKIRGFVVALRPARERQDEVLSAEQLATSMHRERARSNRTGRPFSLVLFQFHKPHHPALDHQRAVELLTCQVRLTDEVGWDEDRHPCVLLTDTPTPGADVFAARICAALIEQGLHATPTVLSYPASDADHDPPTPPDRDNHDDDDPTDPNDGEFGSTADSTRTPMTASVSTVSFAQALPPWKRAIDIVGASIALLTLSPVILVALVAVRVTSSGSAIFKQQRSGLGGRPFWMYKFRTMIDGAERQQDVLRPHNEQDGPAFKLTDDPRITPVGRWLRKTSVDELPQLWNVLRGEMTLVGPRPLPCHESEECRQWHRARLDVTPGITCIWQVNGRCNTHFDRWVRMDLAYARRRTPWTDLKLMLMTVPAVLLQRGAK